MAATVWTLRFGQSLYPVGVEYFCHIFAEDGEPIDTFYGADPQFMFEEVAALLESHATGTGFGAPVRLDAGSDY